MYGSLLWVSFKFSPTLKSQTNIDSGFITDSVPTIPYLLIHFALFGVSLFLQPVICVLYVQGTIFITRCHN